jgi:hypothetical protein
MPRRLLHSIIIIATLVTSVVFSRFNTKDYYVFYGDALGYYVYLPSTFIYHNLKALDHFPEDKGITPNVLHNIEYMGTSSLRTPKGYALNQYTYGVALLEAPFFFAAHLYEKAAGLPANGFSNSYDKAIKASAFVYLLVGCFFIWRVLRRYFSATITLLTLAVLYLATNLFWFTLHQAGMSHQPMFMLYAMLVYYTAAVHTQPRRWYFIVMSFVIGLILVIRPTDIVCILIPLLYGVRSKDTLLGKWSFIKTNIANIGWLALVAFIPVIPQLLFWKSLTGQYIFYSYGSQSFNWAKPKIIEGLFYFNNGFFAYCPVMFLAVIGMLWYRRSALKDWALAIAILFPIYSYIIYSWYCYNYINGLGSRPMIHLYPLLAIPLAAFFQYLASRNMVLKTLTTLVVIFFISVNYSFSALKSRWMLDTELGSIRYCAQMLYRTGPLRYNDMVVFDMPEFQPDESKLKWVVALGVEHFNDSLDEHYVPEIETGAKYVYRMIDGEEYMPAPIKVKYSKAQFKDARWFKCSGRFRFHSWPAYRRHVLVLSANRGDEALKWTGVMIDNKIGMQPPLCDHPREHIDLNHYDNDRWGYVHYYARIPRDMHDGDKIELGIWNISKTEMFIDSMKLEVYK